MNTDREDIADRKISNERLIQLLHEKDDKIYQLELELSEIKREIAQMDAGVVFFNKLVRRVQ
ncbi:MAG: hypothetical protein ACXABD_22995 [Candidatus Thorarchaeota archaeon]|jgi:hypothetical protein